MKYWNFFIELGADDDQLDFSCLCFSTTELLHFLTILLIKKNNGANLDTIIDHIPATVDNSDEPCSSRCHLDYNTFVGRIENGRKLGVVV